MPIYETKGTLTGTIEPENVAAAQRYLQFNHDLSPINMEDYLDEPLKSAVESLMWHLDHDGHHYRVVAFAKRKLTEDELRVLSLEVSGQNSDGLGEGFEQQDFAWVDEPEEEDCTECNGSGSITNDDDGLTLTEDCSNCDGAGYLEREDGHMISFDWETNKLPWTRIK